jgi:hypothetical protein
MGPFEEAVQRLDGIPGISRRVTEEVLAEMGGRHGPVPYSSPPGLLG